MTNYSPRKAKIDLTRLICLELQYNLNLKDNTCSIKISNMFTKVLNFIKASNNPSKSKGLDSNEIIRGQGAFTQKGKSITPKMHDDYIFFSYEDATNLSMQIRKMQTKMQTICNTKHANVSLPHA